MKTTPRASSGESASASSAAANAPSPLLPASAPPTTRFGTDLCVRPVRVPAARPRADVLTEGLHAPQRQACVQGILQAKLRELRTPRACHWGAWSKLHTGSYVASVLKRGRVAKAFESSHVGPCEGCVAEWGMPRPELGIDLNPGCPSPGRPATGGESRSCVTATGRWDLPLRSRGASGSNRRSRDTPIEGCRARAAVRGPSSWGRRQGDRSSAGSFASGIVRQRDRSSAGSFVSGIVRLRDRWSMPLPPPGRIGCRDPSAPAQGGHRASVRHRLPVCHHTTHRQHAPRDRGARSHALRTSSPAMLSDGAPWRGKLRRAAVTGGPQARPPGPRRTRIHSARTT
jgi:hypothetical protein